MTDLIFDVESVGLHGEGFAVAWIRVDGGVEVASFCVASPMKYASGTPEGKAWCEDNVPADILAGDKDLNAADVRTAFWEAWRSDPTVTMWADVAWPVEARFLIACVEDRRRAAERGSSLGPTPREFEGPFPLMDVSTLFLEAGIEEPDRTGAEHHPLGDVRHSLKRLNAARFALRGKVSPRVYRDGTSWCALYGKDLVSGVAGFGETPAKAAAEFEKAWSSGSGGEGVAD